jgi:DNA helicase-2/ATP-dependent DNA helicase PcrA
MFLLEDLRGVLTEMKPASLKRALDARYRDWADLKTEDANPSQRLTSELAAQLVSRQAMLVAELSTVTWQYLSGAEQQLAELQIPHLLVDDYQDLSRASQAITGLLFSETLTVTGNPCQTQALNDPHPCPRGLMDFELASSPTCETIVLRHSLRCPQQVAAAGNALLLSQPEQEDMLTTFDEETPLGRVTAVKWTDPTQECEEITSWIKRRHKDEEDPLELGSVLLVVPNRVWGRQFAKRLDTLKLPYEGLYAPNSLRGNPLRIDASAGMRSFTLLTLAAHPNDAVAWRSWCGFGHRQLNSAAWAQLVDWAQEQNLDISEALCHLAQDDASPFEGSSLLTDAWRRASAILERCKGRKGERLLASLCDGNDPSLDDFEALVRPLDGTETAIELYERARDQLLDPAFTHKRHLRLATFSTAVGLEAGTVILTGMVDGFLPTVSLYGGASEKDTGAQREEGVSQRHVERCALYDTLSKAGFELVFSYFQKADVQVAEKLGMEIRRRRPERGSERALLAPSSFLDEMGHAIPGVVSRLPEG